MRKYKGASNKEYKRLPLYLATKHDYEKSMGVISDGSSDENFKLNYQCDSHLLPIVTEIEKKVDCTKQ